MLLTYLQIATLAIGYMTVLYVIIEKQCLKR